MTPRELIAVPTKGDRGSRNSVSSIFAKAPYFTFVEIIDNKKEKVTVQENEASSLTQGTGPIVMKSMKDRGVDIILAADVGPGAITLMQISGIKLYKVDPGTKVSEAVSRFIESKA